MRNKDNSELLVETVQILFLCITVVLVFLVIRDCSIRTRELPPYNLNSDLGIDSE